MRYKILNFIVLLLILLLSQAYPFIYIHDHNHFASSQLEICIHPPNFPEHKDHSCKESSHDHRHFEVDWDRLKGYETTKNISEKSSLKFLLKDLSDINLDTTFFNPISIPCKNQYFFQISNKSPPFSSLK